MGRYPVIKEANKGMLLRLHRQADLRLCWSKWTLCRFSHDVANLNLRSAIRHASQRDYFLKLFFSTFLFELSKFIRLVRGNHTVRGNQCRKGQ